MDKLTIHRALAELKLITARIEKRTAEFTPSGIIQKDKLVNNVYKQDDFEKTAIADYQSLTALIDRKHKLKSAIVKANSETIVKISGQKMTIAEAINFKLITKHKKDLIERMRNVHRMSLSNIEKNNFNVDQNALQLAGMALSKKEIKIGDDDVQKTIAPFLEANRFKLIDPIGIEKEMVRLEDELSGFQTEVDATLSEANSTTTIEI